MADPTADLDKEFAAFRATIMPRVTPAGPDAVRRTVRRRRRATLTTALATATALVVGPVAGYAALDREPAPDPVVVVTPTPEPTVSTSPTGSPSPTASATAPAAPDGRISRSELLRAKLTLPRWAAQAEASCARLDIRLSGRAIEMGQIELITHRYADVDGDGAEETVAILGCRIGEASHQQVVVFDRDEAARIVTLGQVVRTETLDMNVRKVAWITDLRTDAPGRLQVRVADLQPCCGIPLSWTQFQWRTYTWTGHRFSQTAGERSFKPNPAFTDLVVTGASDVVLTAQDSETRAGSTTVTVRNAGPSDARHTVLVLTIGSGGFAPDGTGWSACSDGPAIKRYESFTNVECDLGSQAAGQARTLVLGFAGPVGTSTVNVEVWVHDLDGEGQSLPDHQEMNNRRSFQMR